MSSFFLPPNSSLQLSDNNGNIAHQGVLGSNISGSTLLTTFPTTSTGNSLGHYHYTEPTTNALKFLNVSGTGSGGHKFYTANSTTAPINTATFDTNGMTIDRSTAGLPILINLPDLTQSTNVVVVFTSPINQAPWNIVGVGNPVQVLQNTANMQTGITYYLTGLSTQLGQLTTNPDGTGIIDTTDLITFPQPILTWESGQFSPSTTQTININDDLTITTGTKSCSLSATLLRNNTIKTTLDMDNNTLQFVDTLGTTITTMASNNYQINNEPEGVNLGLANNRFFITNQSTTTTTNIYTGQVQQTNLTAGTQTVLDTVSLDVNLLNTNQKSSLTSNSLTIRDLTTNVSILSPTDLTFNGVSLPSTVSTNTTNIGTNTTNIATNTSNIATNTTNITKNTNSISKLQYANPINIANSPIIYGTLPSSPPMIPTTNAINSGFNGWYYRNISSAYNNISWSVGFQPSNYVVSNLKGIYFTFVSLTTTSKPFFSVYTLPATPPNFYNSRRSYVPAIAPATITAGIPYIYYYMFDNAYPTPFKYCHTAVPLTLSAVNPVGAFGANELLYFASINTNSISPANTEELIIAEAGVIIDDGTGTLIQPFSFNSASVFSPNSYKAQQQGAGTITPTIINNGTTYIATANFTISNAGLSGVPAGFFIIVQGTTTDRTITYNTSATKTVHTNTGTTNASQVIFYWLGDTFVAYN